MPLRTRWVGWAAQGVTSVLVAVASVTAVYGQIPATQRQALLDLYNSTNGAQWTSSLNWNGSAGTECTWFGVTCDATATTVQALQLRSNNLVGFIPASLADLSNLEVLDLDANALGGGIPGELGNLGGLQHLDLGGNQLTGSIPSTLGNLAALEYLDLYGGDFRRTPIPSTFGNLTNLRFLDLGNCGLAYGIPPALGNLTQLQSLYLYGNDFGGTVPDSFGNLVNLWYLYLSGDQLTGPVPAALASLTNLRALDLSSNSFSGPIPGWIGGLAQLQILNLGADQLSGPIPAELGALSNVSYLYLRDNLLSGPIPATLGQLSQLRRITLEGNMLVGSLPASLANLGSLTLGGSDFRWNGLYTDDPAVDAVLRSAQLGGDWSSTQTIAPAAPGSGAATTRSITVTWTPVAYVADPGFYRIGLASAPGGPYTLAATTAGKTDGSWVVGGLSPGTTYYFVVDTVTSAHEPNNANTVVSDHSSEVSAATAQLPQLVITTGCPLPAGRVTVPYSAQLAASDGSGAYTWSVTGGALPPGLQLSSAGLISGTPESVGASSFAVTVTDSAGDAASEPCSLTVSAVVAASERQALLDLFSALDGRDWMDASNWGGPVGTECTWSGVTCDRGETAVIQLALGGNHLEGTVPDSLAALTHLQRLDLSHNRLSGAVPPMLRYLAELWDLELEGDGLSGPIPSWLGTMGRLQVLDLAANGLTGSIPPQLGDLSRLQSLQLSMNELSGPIPAELGSLASLQLLSLADNQLSGTVPQSLEQLSGLVPGGLALGWNALHTSDAGLDAFLRSKQAGGDWSASQTVAPTGVVAVADGSSSVTLSWTPVAYTSDPGFYRIYVSTMPGGPYALIASTGAKSDASWALTGLPAGAVTHYFVVDTVTRPNANNMYNTVESDHSAEVAVSAGEVYRVRRHILRPAP